MKKQFLFLVPFLLIIFNATTSFGMEKDISVAKQKIIVSIATDLNPPIFYIAHGYMRKMIINTFNYVALNEPCINICVSLKLKKEQNKQERIAAALELANKIMPSMDRDSTHHQLVIALNNHDEDTIDYKILVPLKLFINGDPFSTLNNFNKDYLVTLVNDSRFNSFKEELKHYIAIFKTNPIVIDKQSEPQLNTFIENGIVQFDSFGNLVHGPHGYFTKKPKIVQTKNTDIIPKKRP